MSAYEEGLDLGRTVKEIRDEGINYDIRHDLADEAKTRSKPDFTEFMRGVNDAFTQETK